MARRDPIGVARLVVKRVDTRVKRRLKRPAVSVLRSLNWWMRRASAATHRLQGQVEWRWPPTPEWFDHHVGAQYLGQAERQNLGEERGVFTNLIVPAGGRVLDMCCGDGYYSRYFYAHRAESVVAVDFDPEPIGYARKVNAAPNIAYEVRDVRVSLPDGPFDAVVWNGAIEHFTDDEVAVILARVRERLSPGGVLAGDTVLARSDGSKQLVHHEREYRGERDLLRTLRAVFAHACVWRVEWGRRTELYFYASNDEAAIPFAAASGRLVTD